MSPRPRFQPLSGPSGRPLDRRTLLRGGAAALALPWLEAMAPKREIAAPPKRYVALFCPNGMLPSAWRPEATGSEFALPPTLEPIAPVRDQVVVLGNLFNRASRAGEGHYVKTTAWLSGAPVKRTGGRDLHVGKSIDQHIAGLIGAEAPLASLVLGVEPVRNRVDMGYSTVYGANISWRTATQPAAREIEPRRAYERVVRWTGARGATGASRALDLVLEEARTLRAKVGGADRAKLDEYLESVHSLETRLDALGATVHDAIHLEVPEDPGEYPERVQLMLDLLVLAIRTDATRVGTLMFGNSVSGRSFSFLDGVEGGHHGLSHHEKKEEKKAQYALINRWHVERFAWFLEALRSAPEGDGTVLDSTMVQFGSGLADGNRHDPNDLPILLGGGPFRGGRHLRQEKLTPLCNLYASILEAMGARETAFGDSTGRLAGL